MLKEACEYKELGAEYLNQRMEQKRKNYLKKELESLGYKVKISRDNVPIPEIGYKHREGRFLLACCGKKQQEVAHETDLSS